jgi:hypothetical protein
MSSRQLTRRQLGQAAAVALLADTTGRADDEKPKKPPVNPLAVSADALLEIVKVRHGKQLDEAQLKQVRQSLLSGLGTADRLKKIKLRNGDEPAFVFQADAP